MEKLGYSKNELGEVETSEKIKILYDYRQNQYQKLADAVYFRRGWTPNGVPTTQKMNQLGIKDPKMLKMLKEKIEEDEKNGLNVWGGKYRKNEEPPSKNLHYWKKW
jgi:hypothetical protein